jgi:hypothetical protein
MGKSIDKQKNDMNIFNKNQKDELNSNFFTFIQADGYINEIKGKNKIPK